MSVLIDIDGTILNTQEKKHEAYQEIIEVIRKTFSFNNFNMDLFWSIVRIQFELFSDYRKNDMIIRLKMIRAFLDLPIDEFDLLLPHLIELYWNKISEGHEIPIAKNFLKELSNNNIIFYLFSDSSIEETQFKMKLFSKGFFPNEPTIFLTDHRESPNSKIITLGKNKIKETYQFLKDNYNARIMIGDSELFDILPAKQAGLEAFNIQDENFDNLLDKIFEVLK